MVRMRSPAIEHLAYRGCYTLPVGPLRCQFLLACRGERVRSDAPALGRFAPGSFDPAVLLQAMERGKEGAGFDLKRAAGDLRDAVGNGYSVPRLKLEGAENQEVESAFQELGGL